MPIELRVLAGRDLIGPDGRTVHALLVQPKRFALLVYLLLDRPFRNHSRDELLALFWPDLREANARNALSQALSFLRRSVGDGVIVARGTDEVTVNRDLFTCDALAFEEAATRGDGLAALAVYRRDLLDGFHVDDAPEFHQWLESERVYFRGRAVACVRALMTRASEDGDHNSALSWAMRWGALAPHDEAMVTQVIRLHDRLGNRAEAVRAFTDFSSRLLSELHLEPSEELITLVDRIRTGSGGYEAIPDPAGHDGLRRVRRGSPMISDRELVAGGADHAPRLRSAMLRGASTVMVGTAAAVVAWMLMGARSPMVQRARFTLALEDSVRLRSDLPGVTIALSPDGSQLVYTGGVETQRLLLRALDSLAPRTLAGTENASNPQFSPDGKWLGFVADGHLRKLPLSGGPTVAIADSVGRFSWGDGGVIVFSRIGAGGAATGDLWKVSAAGGAAARLTRRDSSQEQVVQTWPHFLPGGKAILLDLRTGGTLTAELAAMRLADGKVVRLGLQGSNARYSPSGHIVFGRMDGTVLAAPFDAELLEVTGPAVPVLEHVTVKSGGAMEIAVARNGTLVYVPRKLARQLVMVDRGGASRVLRPELMSYAGPRFSPDGGRLAIVIGEPGAEDIWIYDVAAGTRRRLTKDGWSGEPSWMPDGQRVAWHTRDGMSGDIVWQYWDGRGTPTTLLRDVDAGVMAPTGAFLFATHVARGTHGPYADVVSLDEPPRRTPYAPDQLRQPRVSPDGRWLAFGIGQAHRREVYVEAMSGGGRKYQISSGGGTEPVWGPTGRELFYRARGKVVSATITTVPEPAVVRRDTLFDDAYWSTPNDDSFADYDVSPDGVHFVFVRTAGEPEQPVVVFGWLDEMKAKVALRAKH